MLSATALVVIVICSSLLSLICVAVLMWLGIQKYFPIVYSTTTTFNLNDSTPPAYLEENVQESHSIIDHELPKYETSNNKTSSADENV